MKHGFLLLAGIFMAAFLSACGSVSHVKPTAGQAFRLDNYQRVVVNDFADGVTEKAKPKNKARKQAEMDVATKAFADRIAIELGAKGAFKEVVRTGTADANTLVITGTITRYEEGSSSARLWVGMGAGSAYFDADIVFKDGGTSGVLANQVVDKNSWGGGGAIAASQTPESFMKEAAKKLAEDISALKLTGKLPTEEHPNEAGKKSAAK